MSTINNGGPAFPSAGDGNETWAHEGMTLRDYFAAKAMQGILAGWASGLPPSSIAAEAAYDLADAMLKARNK